ncbi:unnamed protein product [Rotaria sordida]|uniref:PH domain-containing protein n=1 Tax=Rotaria sordida TaxID=392033 RepID=A0A814MDW4_9BILA|nr:unnamed protein product [Rotaria sordida]CAF1073109.1 unnamed protein product [Rotaria sordida]CAF1078016.1 unnamed protein product [Rotaria sordida]
MMQHLPSNQEEPLSHNLFIPIENSLKQTDNNSKKILKIKFQSKSLDDLRLHRECQHQQTDDNYVSNTTRTEIDLSTIGCNMNIDINEKQLYDDDKYDLREQKCQSAPVSPTKIYDKELATFIECEQKLITDSFVYNIDLSDTNDITCQPQARTAIFFDEDYLSDSTPYEPPINNIIQSSLINCCVTITEENEEELEQLRRDDEEEKQRKQHHLLKINDGSKPTVTLHDNDDRADILENENESEIIIMNNINNFEKLQDDNEHLSTIYESLGTQLRTDEEDNGEEEEEIYDDAYDKLIVYDIANVESIEKSLNIHPKLESIMSPSSSYRSPILDRNRIRSCYTDASSLEPSSTPTTNTLSASNLCGTTTMIASKVFTPPFINNNEKSSSSPVINNQNNSINKSLTFLPIKQEASSSKSSHMSLSVPMLLLPITIEQNTCMIDNNQLISMQHVKKMKVIQSSSSSLSDFIMPASSSTLKSTIHYEEVPSVHHSLTDCSSIHRISCCAPITDEDYSTRNKSSNDNQRRPSFTRRILTNGLLLSHCSSSNSNHRRTQPPLTFNQYRHQTKPKSEEKLSSVSSPVAFLSSSSSSSSESNSPSGEKFMSRSDFIPQQQQNISQQRKATSLKTIAETSNHQPSKILYPIDFQTKHIDQSWYQKHLLSSSHYNKVPTSDSGIVIDTVSTRPTSKSSIEENDGDGIPIDITNSGKLKQYQSTYQKTLADLTIIKKNIVDIESRLSEAMRELEIERALVESEHELVFKQILNASESDQQKIRHLYNDLQLLSERIMAEKNSIRNEIDYTQQILFKLEHELRELEEQYRPSDDKILKKKEIIAETRKKHEDLEFQLMELETRCEAELEQAEEHFQSEQILIEQNTTIRQNTLHDLDRQQNVILHQVIVEKEKLEREKQKLKLLFKQKKLEANELEQKINNISSKQENSSGNDHHHQQSINSKNVWFNGNTTVYHSTPSNLYSSINYSNRISSPKMHMKDKEQEKLNEIKEMIAVAKLEKMTVLEQQLRERYNELLQCHDEHIKRVELEQKLANEIQNREYLIQCQVKLREKNRMQERPLTRYLPIRSLDFDLRAHIEGAGHLLDSPHIHITSTSCRGFLLKMGGMKFKTWNRRWFVFDRKRRSLFYYQDKTETKLRGCIYFQSIVEVYVDHLQSISLRSPEPREATFIVKTIERPYYLVAPTVESMRIWVDVIITGAEGNTFAGES